ncbi:MAG: chemotaxis protein CheA [Pseudomonadota bacterium]
MSGDTLDAIKATFFQECDELLADLEAGLLALESGEDDGDTINAVFRAVHSVKGGAGAFGFDDLVGFAHVFETALDEMRSGKLDPAPETIKLMLRASDVLADHVGAMKGEGAVDEAQAGVMAQELAALTGAPTHEDEAPANADEPDGWGFTPLKFDMAGPASAGWRLTLRPTAALYAKGNDALLLLRELERLGPCETTCERIALPALDALVAEQSYLTWTVLLPGELDEASIHDIFDFIGDDCPITLERIEAADTVNPASAEIDITALINSVQSAPAVAAPTDDHVAIAKGAKADAASPTIRVNLERVDRLIDLVGELVINQAMLAQRVAETGLARSSTVAIGLDELEQLTREIQDSVMAIRAQPVKSVFQRMPRLVREIAASTGKEVRLVTEGESTEVDKTVIERLSDPITHMLRNAIDHGLETPEVRVAAGKGAEGTVRLAALHRSGRIVIEVSDDGKGIDRPRVREIAVNKGLIAPDVPLSDDEIDNLIFLPGFSTATTVSNISGRGVGMDVVKRSIQSLGGRISISSQPGKGSTFTLSLPLTLAVLDGMVVSAGPHTLVAPLSCIVETLQPKPREVRRLGPASAVLSVRGSHVPLVDIGVALGWRHEPIDPSTGVVLLVESEVGGRAAIVVDAIQGQRQVVIKSLEANYQRVDAVAAATILGDGRVALILDVDAIVDTRLGATSPLQRAS